MEKEEIIRKVLEKNKIEKLNPVQKLAIDFGILDGKNLIISSPTSSGKTLLAELAGLNTTLNRYLKMIYLSPLVALTREKYEDFRKKYEDLGIKVALSVGNFDSQDPFLANFDWICLSNEKMDSLIRHKPPWISDIGLIVVDEIHLLNDFQRGPTIEILITILKKICPQAQFLLLSATIKNPQDLEEWIEAKVVKSNFRPVPLYYGIFTQGRIRMFGKEDYFLSKDLNPEEAIVENTLLAKKQMVFFLSSRRNAEALAERLSRLAFHFLNEKEFEELREISKKIENVLEIPTEQCKKLARCIEKGVAFYHSGILFPQRILIEEAYKKGLIKIITSTTALAFGINLPTFRVVIRDLKRFYPGLGSFFIPVLEVQQMFGRAGRPQFDRWGEGILIAKSEIEANELEEYYIKGEFEEIKSQITNETALRTHLLSLISGQFLTTERELLNFFKETFFGKTIQDVYQIKDNIEKIIFQLEKWGFIFVKDIEKNGESDLEFFPTKIGQRISQLYLDPFTANLFIEGLKNLSEWNLIAFLSLLSKATELQPLPNLTSKDLEIVEEIIIQNEESFLFEVPDVFDDEYEEFLREVKMALIFKSWIEEMTQKEIMEIFKITPGELHSRLEILDWLLYSILEIEKLIGFEKEIKEKIKKLRIQVKYGIKEELLDLVRLEGIGRVRARALFEAGIKNIKELKKISKEKLSKILKNKVLAEKILEKLKNEKLIDF
jgi:helicase